MTVVAAPRPAASHQFNAVKISLSLDGNPSSSQPTSDNRILFDISIGGKQVGLVDATVGELGLPLTVVQARNKQTSDLDYRLPDHIGAALEHVVPSAGEPLWLSFPQPSGYLPIVPWESLLYPRLDVPILRLCYTDVQPIISALSLDIIVCFSFPISKQVMNPEGVINYFLDHIPENMQSYTTFHVFADAEVQPLLLEAQKRIPQCQINIYDPRQASQYNVPSANSSPSDSMSDVESPWLLWIRDAMGSRSADVVHFFCHGYLGREDGFLCFSQSPLQNDDQQFSRFVGARQICSFLDQVGAWSVAFSSQPGNYSIAGLRLLHDQMAHIRPGPVLYHDMYLDPASIDLCAVYQYAYAIEEASAPRSKAISLICHPDWAMPIADPENESKTLVDSLTLAGRMPAVFEGFANTPSWLASGQRSLERSVAQLISATRGNSSVALHSGTAEALRFVSDVLERHAKALAPGIKEKL